MEELRTIITSYMVISKEKGPLAIGNKEEAENWLKMAQEKGYVAKIKEVTTNMDRIQEIGKRLFEIDIPTDKPLLEYRNDLVSKLEENCERLGLDPSNCDITKAWKKIANQEGLDVDFDEFHNCIMDKIEYGTY